MNANELFAAAPELMKKWSKMKSKKQDAKH